MGRDNISQRPSSKLRREMQPGRGNMSRAPGASTGGNREMRPRDLSSTRDDTMRLPVARQIPRQHAPHQTGATRATWTTWGPATGWTDVRSTLWSRLWGARGKVLAWAASALVAALAVKLMLHTPAAQQLAAFLYAFNFDGERVLLMTTLLMTLSGCALASVFLRRRLPVIVGGMLAFCGGYLYPLVLRVQQPPPGPAGIKQELIPGALPHLSLTLIAIALVCAGSGAAMGAAYGELVVTPLLRLASQLRARMRQPMRTDGQAVARTLPRTALSLALGGLLVVAMVLSAAVPGTLLTYGIAGTLYRLAPGARGDASAAQGTVLQSTYISPSLKGISRTYFIYLPPSYALASSERYPVLYMLHGSPGTPHNWVGAGKGPSTEDALVALGKMRETIIVSPDGNGPVYTYSEWANSFDGRQRMEDAIALDLVHYIDQHYRTLPDAADRVIGGNSEGGFGAVNIALHHPDIFGAALTMGGYFTADSAIFGYGKTATQYRLYNSPSSYIFTPSGLRAVHALHLVICVGTSDGEFYTDGVTLHKQWLQAGGHATLLTDTGGHSWELWALELGESLPLLEAPIVAQGTHP